MSVIGITNTRDLPEAIKKDHENLRANQADIRKKLEHQQALQNAYRLVMTDLGSKDREGTEAAINKLSHEQRKKLSVELEMLKANNHMLLTYQARLSDTVLQRIDEINRSILPSN